MPAVVTLRTKELLAGTNWPLGAGEFVEFVTDPAVLPQQMRKLWCLLLLMAESDRATSVHYRPWRPAQKLTYLVDWQQYELIPPPSEYETEVIAAARSLFTPRRGLIGRVLPLPKVACGTVALDESGIVWDAVWWSNGERSGVELLRVTPLGNPPVVSEIPPSVRDSS